MNIIEKHTEGYHFREQNYKYCFDLENWRKSNSYAILKKYCNKDDEILEIGCLTGHHLILLAQDGYKNLRGIDFVEDAIKWGKDKINKLKIDVKLVCAKFPDDFILDMQFDKIILFDVLEHVDNLGDFLKAVSKLLNKDGEVLILVPKGIEYFDCCHINFYPNYQALSNLLINYFNIVDTLETQDNKIFARCIK